MSQVHSKIAANYEHYVADYSTLTFAYTAYFHHSTNRRKSAIEGSLMKYCG